jgi:hypothetical protein
MTERILKVYDKVNSSIEDSQYLFNDKNFRNGLEIRLKRMIGNDCIVVCNEQNNDFKTYCMGVVVATVYWVENNIEMEMNLVFGYEENINKVLSIV